MTINKKSITNPIEITEHLADHFEKQSSNSVYSKEFLTYKMKCEQRKITFSKNQRAEYNRPFSMNEMFTQLDRLQGTSTGPDEIHNEMLKKLPFFAKRKLLETLNSLWEKEQFPDTWREAYLIPIPKPGKSQTDPNNLRPIYLSSCMMKLFERMVNKRLMQELESKNIFGTSQYAFRKGFQTLDPLVEIENICKQSINNQNHTELLFLDLEKAYDRTWKHLILEKLVKTGIGGKMASFCSSFLKERRFKVLYKGEFSTTKHQINGVPQGSVMAVTFFLLAIDSINEWLSKETVIKIYADDITIAVTTKRAYWTRKKIQTTLNNLSKWSDRTGFKISIQKSSIMHVGSRKKLTKQPPATLNGTKINMENIVRILGIHMDKSLNFQKHITIKRNECQKTIGLLQCLGNTNFRADRNSLLRITKQMLIPRLLYGIPIINGANEKELNRLSPILHKALKISIGAHFTSPTKSIIAESGTLPLDKIIQEHSIKYTSKAVIRLKLPSDFPICQRLEKYYQKLNIQPYPLKIGSKNRCWQQEKPTTNLEIAENATPIEKRQQFYEMKSSKYKNHYHIYTDGSKTSGGVGCGIYSTNLNEALPLPSQLSIFSAEAYAINRAIDLAPKLGLTVIFSDSKSVLLATQSNKSDHPWIEEINRKLSKSNGRIELCWTPAHINIKGNEKADYLAKQGTTLTTEPNFKIPFEDFKRLIKNKIYLDWERDWQQSTEHLRRIKNSTRPWDNIIENRKDSKLITKLRIGHTWLSHGHIIRKEAPKLCQTCNTRITTEHLLIDCPRFMTERRECNVGSSIFVALSDDKNQLRNTIKFLKRTQLYNEI